MATYLAPILLFIVGANAGGLLYPHMQNNHDMLGPISDEESLRMHFKSHFKYWGVIHKSMYIYENGVLAFTPGFRDYTPSPLPLTHYYYMYYRLVLPYWADFNIGKSGAGSHIWFRETKDTGILDRATNDVKNAFECSPDFKAGRVVIVTWQRVKSYYGASYCADEKRDLDVRSRQIDGKYDEVPQGKAHEAALCDDTAGENSFQIVLISAGLDKESFIMFNYHTIEWGEGYPGYPAVSGFHRGEDGDFVNLDFQGTDLPFNSNVGKDGRYMYKTDETPMGPDAITC